MEVQVRSRTGNVILGILGVVYFFAALALLVYDVIQTWGAASLVDRGVQGVLVISALAGIFFALIASRNLGLRVQHREAPPRREGAAVSP